MLAWRLESESNEKNRGLQPRGGGDRRTLRNTAFQTRVERVAREEGDELRLAGKLTAVSVLLAHGHESWESSDWLGAGGINMVHIVVVHDSEVWYVTTARATRRVRDLRLCGGLMSSHCV